MAMRSAIALCLAVAAVCANPVPREERLLERATASNAGWNGQTTNVQTGKTGVSAMQLVVVGHVSLS